jgi:UDP-glucose 4-epimerase
MHFAAYSLVGESMQKPEIYYENNVYGTLNLLKSMIEHDVNKIIFSSTAAVYGEPQYTPIDEEHPKNPTNVYGETKITIEKMLDWFDKIYGLKSVRLRYFNAAGADPSGEIGELHNPETHLIPIVLQAALGERPFISVFGNDYDTRDGTCVRDYIHVNDLAKAHILALDYLSSENKSNFFNLGNGNGYTVKEVIEVAKKVTNIDIPVKIADRRPGDPAILVASSDKIKNILGWKPEFDSIETIISTAWKWHNGKAKEWKNG